MSTPYTATRNRFVPLQSTGDDVEEDDPPRAADQTAFTKVRSRKTKRIRDHSSQQLQPLVSNTQSGRRTSERRAPTILGQSSFPGSKIATARDIRRKAVFCVDNVSTSCTTEDIKSFVSKTLSIEVLSCYTAQPRRRSMRMHQSMTGARFVRVSARKIAIVYLMLMPGQLQF